MIDLEVTVERVQTHLHTLTRTIGERSIATPWNLRKAAEYIEGFYQQIGIATWREVSNVVGEVGGGQTDAKTFLVGAHYDSVSRTVGADDNASGVAVQLEVARALAEYSESGSLARQVRFVSFALEEPPVYGTSAMGSRVR